MHIYGESLLHFPELISSYTLYHLVPNIGASGYSEKQYKGVVRGYVQYPTAVRDSSEANMRIGDLDASFYALAGEYTPQYGDSLVDKKRLFTIHGFADFEVEGGFIVCYMKIVSGVLEKNVVQEDLAAQVFSDFDV